jgi:D-serine deaminase-like pyridoxal phosphate-dependent protein
MRPALALYALHSADRMLTPALLVYPELVQRNIETTLGMLNGDPDRWRPHIKTAKLSSVIQLLLANGIRSLKCATTLELLTACRAGAEDVLLAFSVTGANARRVIEIAASHPRTRISVLIEAQEQWDVWRGTGIGCFIDVNSGMDRTGTDANRVDQILSLARYAGPHFRGLHWYDGHIAGTLAERASQAHAGYDRLVSIAGFLAASGVAPEELITSGTAAAPHALSYSGFQGRGFKHRVSPGTVVYNDVTSIAQLAEFDYVPAVAVLTTVISSPRPGIVTCDAGHKSVSADAGTPNCRIVGRDDLEALKPSEEHLPIKVVNGGTAPSLGERLYLIPRHVCPTVNNFDHAVIVRKGDIERLEVVAARGHENPLVEIEDAMPARIEV